MTWGQGSTISQRIKDQVRRRDKTCQLQYPDVCTGSIDEFDHPDGLAARGEQRRAVKSAAEVQGVCTPCHGVKSERQRRAGLAAATERRGGRSRRLRDLEPHPGRL